MKVTFGPFTLDDDRRQLLDGTEPVHLSPKAYDVLRLLLQRRPAAVAKNDIHDVVWPRTFVTDVTMATVMSELRAALGDPADRSRFIRTVRGFGYAFACEALDVDRKTEDVEGCWVTWGERHLALRLGANVLGREPRVGLWLDSLSVSRRHARIDLANGAATLTDLGSKNGTFLNGERLRCPTELVDGDAIGIGTVTLVFRNSRAPGTTETVKTAGER